MPEDDSVARRVRKLVVEHAETRWLTLHLDNDVQEIRGELAAIRAVQETQTKILENHTVLLRGQSARLDEVETRLQEHSAQLQEHTTLLQEHTGRFDSVDAQLRSLTHLVGEVLERLPGEPKK